MAAVLFVDACARGWEISSTYAVAEAFLAEYRERNPGDTVEELTLTDEHLDCYTARGLERRDALLKKGALTDEYFRLARQFAAADKLIIAAPYWDLSFPALLKIYLEHISVIGIAFCYDGEGREIGLCKAEKALYVTTSGDAFSEESMAVRGTGVAYLKGLFSIYGISRFDCLWGQGLDAAGSDRAAVLARTCGQAVELAKSW